MLRQPTGADGAPPSLDIPGGWVIEDCDRCQGRGYHRGFGETGHDPDWCESCGGASRIWVPTTDEGRAAFEAVIAAHDPDPDCPDCGGFGEIFGHAEDCRSDFCALAAGYEDCGGLVQPRACVLTPRTDTGMAAVERQRREGGR